MRFVAGSGLAALLLVIWLLLWGEVTPANVVSGLRSSCDAKAMKSSFIRSCSARAEISCIVTTDPTMCSSISMGEMLTSASITWPSAPWSSARTESGSCPNKARLQAQSPSIGAWQRG